MGTCTHTKGKSPPHSWGGGPPGRRGRRSEQIERKRMFSPNPNSSALVRTRIATAMTPIKLRRKRCRPHRRAHEGNASQGSGTMTSCPLHVPPRRPADLPRRAVEDGRIELPAQAPRRGDEERRPLLNQLREVLGKCRVVENDLPQRVEPEKGLGHEKLERHVLVLPLQGPALRPLQDEVDGHQARRNRPP